LTADTHPRRGARGFTLIELLVVLAIMGLVLSLVLGHMPMRSATLDVRAAAADIAGTLRGARARSIAIGRPVDVAVDVGQRTLRIDDGPPAALPATIALSAVAVSSLASSKGIAGFRFLPDGSASGGRIELAEGAQHLRVDVDWLTGRVSIAAVP
jgi:general secretion pathway protein H